MFDGVESSMGVVLEEYAVRYDSLVIDVVIIHNVWVVIAGAWSLRSVGSVVAVDPGASCAALCGLYARRVEC